MISIVANRVWKYFETIDSFCQDAGDVAWNVARHWRWPNRKRYAVAGGGATGAERAATEAPSMSQSNRDRPTISPLLRDRVRSVPDSGGDGGRRDRASIQSDPLVARALERFEHHRREMQRWGEFLKMCRELDAEDEAEPSTPAEAAEPQAARG